MRVGDGLDFGDGTRQVTAFVPGAVSFPGTLPYLIPADSTFVVPVNQVAVMATTCQNDGLLVVDGMIVEVV